MKVFLVIAAIIVIGLVFVLGPVLQRPKAKVPGRVRQEINEIIDEFYDPHKRCGPNASCGMEASNGRWYGKCIARSP